MYNLNAEQKLFLKERIITDKTNIEKFNKEFNYNYFIPNHEVAGIDTEIITKNIFITSKSVMGERVPILVAVNPNDPLFKHSKFRIHGRIIDGKHKYLASKHTKTQWAVTYVFIASYNEFNNIWLHADIVKSEQSKNIQLKQRVIDYCEFLWMQKPKEINDSKGIPQIHNIGKLVVKKFEGQRAKDILYDFIPREYINPKLVKSQPRKIQSIPKSKKDIAYNQVIQERDQLLKRNTELEQRIKPESEKDKTLSEYHRQIDKLKLHLSNAKTYLKKERKRLGLDEKEKDFEIWWSKIVG